MNMDLDEEIDEIIYELIKIATKKSISLGYSYEDFRYMQHEVVVKLMIHEGYIFEDYALFRNEIESGDCHPITEGEWRMIQAKAGNSIQVGGQDLTEEEALKFIEEVRASLKDEGGCVE